MLVLECHSCYQHEQLEQKLSVSLSLYLHVLFLCLVI